MEAFVYCGRGEIFDGAKRYLFRSHTADEVKANYDAF